MTCGIYRIYHKATGKSYVGQSIDITGRLWNHFRMLNNKNHHCVHLQNAFNLYGSEAFERQILETCEQSELTEREQFWMDTARYMYGVYNLAPAAGSVAGIKHSEETRHRMSEAQKGNNSGRTCSEEHRQKISSANKGKSISEETRRRMSEAAKRRKSIPRSKEHCRKISEALKGRKQSEEAKAKIGAATRLRRAKQKDGLLL